MTDHLGQNLANLKRGPMESELIGRYHHDDEINAEVAADALAAERANLAAGYAPQRWQCECGAEHGRGHFQAIGVHRCLGCGYVGTGGVMLV